MQNTLGGAVDTAAHLPTQASAALLDTARTAFTSGLSTAAIAGTIAIVAVAAIVTLLLRSVPIDADLGRRNTHR